MRRILLVEDDRALAGTLLRALREAGYDVTVVHEGNGGLAGLRSGAFDLCVLDGGLPGIDGFEALQRARAEGIATPVLILTARDTTADRVRGLDLGADDYMQKPFALEELFARLRALLRRAPALRQGPVRYGEVEVDLGRRIARCAGKPVELSALQFQLLALLLERAPEVVPRMEILRKVWDYDFDPGTNIIDVHIAILRQKLDDEGAPSRIRTVRGVGYAMTEMP